MDEIFTNIMSLKSTSEQTKFTDQNTWIFTFTGKDLYFHNAIVLIKDYKDYTYVIMAKWISHK